MYWLKNDREILDDTTITISNPTPAMSVIMITNVHRSHSGKYSCVATNQAGHVEQHVQLKVKGIFPQKILKLIIHYDFVWSLKYNVR